LITLFGCGAIDCIEIGTGIHKSSSTMELSKENKVFQFEMTYEKGVFQLDSGKTFKINNAWVEDAWTYECINNNPVVTKDNFTQFVIDGEYNGTLVPEGYVLMENDLSKGSYLGSRLDFSYSGEDTLVLHLMKDKKTLETIKFYKGASH
jgi:hypothetical protein